jgi:lipopolysaccharide transport system permease protein
MAEFSAAPSELLRSAWRNKALIGALTWREVRGRYTGSAAGLLWSFLTPVVMLVVYTFVFSVVFNARWNTGSDSKTEFALLLFAGLIVYNLFAECINRSPTLILSNANYVKKVIFPLEVLPWVTVGSALFHAAVSLLVWLIAHCLLFGWPHVSTLLLPFVVVPLVLFTIGLSWGLAAVGVFLRDVSQFTSIVTTVVLFLSPIFYPASALPEQYQKFLYLNPLTPIIEETRKLLFFGELPSFGILFAALIVSSVVCWLGFAVFQKTRKGFADVL